MRSRLVTPAVSAEHITRAYGETAEIASSLPLTPDLLRLRAQIEWELFELLLQGSLHPTDARDLLLSPAQAERFAGRLDRFAEETEAHVHALLGSD